MSIVTTCTRRLTFCAGHRVLGHESKCANAHGHNYVVEIEAEAGQLDSIGRVVDFSVLKDAYGKYIDLWMDHGFLVFHQDVEMVEALKNIKGQKIYYMPVNPTAENIAAHLLELAPALLQDAGVRVVRIVIHETENCKAEVIDCD